MISLTYEKLSNPKFKVVVRKVGNIDLPNRIASKLHYLVKGINQGLRRVSDDYKEEIEKQFGEIDQDGKVVRDPGNPEEIKMREDKTPEERHAAEEKFAAKVFEFDREPLNQHDLAEARLSAFDLEELGPLYVEVETNPVRIGKVRFGKVR